MGRSNVEGQWPEKNSSDRFKIYLPPLRSVSFLLSCLLSWVFPSLPVHGRRPGPARSRTTSRRISRESTATSLKPIRRRSRDWPTVGLDYAETRFSKLNQINADNVKDLGLVWVLQSRILARRRGDARSSSTASCTSVGPLERGPCHRRADRQEDLDLRSGVLTARRGYQGLLRRRQPRRRTLQGQGLRRRLRRTPDRARCRDRRKVWEKDTHRSITSIPTRSPARRASSRAR